MRKCGRRKGLVFSCRMYVSKLGRVMPTLRAGLYFPAEERDPERRGDAPEPLCQLSNESLESQCLV